MGRPVSSLHRLIRLGGALLLGLLLVGLTSSLPVAQAASPDVIITEIQAANTRTVADDQGGYSDWIELHNPTGTPITLDGYTLTDDAAQPDQWNLPATTLAPGAFLVVWASGADRVTSEGWHTNFRLNRGGEYVGLFGPDGQLVDGVKFGLQHTDISLGRLGLASDLWVAFPTPTPGAANTGTPRPAPDAAPVVVTPGSGRYTGPMTIRLAAPLPGSIVYYTLDGSDPTVDGQAYTAPLELTETTVLRAVALDNGVPVSAVTTATYLVDESTGLPVLSLVTDPAHLWDAATGIYANPEERGRRWERPATVEWLPPAGNPGFSVGTGLRIHGGTSRTESAKQSFRLYFRGEYGPRELAYPLFGVEPGQTYDRLILRAGFNDSWLRAGGRAVYVRDQLVRDLHGAMGQVAARGRWVALYLNGDYWGLYNLTERIDETFLATHFGHDDWDIVRPGAGEHVAWTEFVYWITGTDLSEAAQYEQAVQQLDIENFTSFVILELWAGDTDWGGGNWYATRMRNGPDARWRLFVWDAEATFSPAHEIDVTEDISFSQVLIDNSALGPLITILASLLDSPQYQAYFTAQIERHLAGALDTASVRERIATLVTALRPAMAAEAVRWRPEQEPAAAVDQWAAALQRLADSLDTNAQLLHQLRDLETFRQLLPQFPVPDAQSPLPPGTRVALLVHHPAELTLSDTAIVAHLAERGATVTVLGTGDGSTHDPAQVAVSHDLLLLSSSIRTVNTVARYAQTTTPLIFWEPRLLDESGVPLALRGGTRPKQTEIWIVDADHPITAGLPADQPLRVVYWIDTLSVAYPSTGPGVQVLAKHLLGGDSAILVAEVGAELSNGQPAQARTVFLYWHHDTFLRSTGEAVRLFDRAVDWALGLSPDDGS